MMKLCGVVVAIALAGSVSMAQDRGDYRGGGRGDHGYWDGSRHYGYYRNPAGELVFGLVGLGLLAAVVASTDHPVYVQPPVVVRETPQVVYVQQPAPVYVQQPVVVQQPVTITVSIQNSNGSFTPVILRQAGAQWVGPKGEYYDAVPSVGQLRPIYGF